MTTPSRPMQKFGLQTSLSLHLTLWRNGDRYQSEGVKIVVHPKNFKTYDQLKLEFSKKIQLFVGNVVKVYSMDKKLVKDIDGFVDHHNYICCGGEKLNDEVIPKGIQDIFGKAEPMPEESAHTPPTSTTFVPSVPPPPKSPSKPSQPSPSSTTPVTASPVRKPVVAAYKDGLTQDKFSVQTEKAKVVYAYRNGDKYHKGERVTIHSTKFKTYDQLKEQLSKQVQLPTGSVRKAFSADGKLVKTMDDFVDGDCYICCGGEPLNATVSNFLLEQVKQKQQHQQQQ
ncbi:hypothetical protein DICPUDRAFT_59184 [Dictyostelium purpureum]|uniref:Doublecortin domain-containing protein n=1 Tax=Dictyostelium purpureum TaxID=5786 RepID=F1A4S9_DICPU|nr:uncharacterized protein DICPUDRAFT_59184 [Dictyostelium purpureum]EGC28799.1 hypothetical protein DICPUDRAFT_59184 [Dictyostelium purpureum]|eukprot:XP_003294672.1 hypothetical protein DICPUDRAFT_59184 [Dictyostelium purpureum]